MKKKKNYYLFLIIDKKLVKDYYFLQNAEILVIDVGPMIGGN